MNNKLQEKKYCPKSAYQWFQESIVRLSLNLYLMLFKNYADLLYCNFV